MMPPDQKTPDPRAIALVDIDDTLFQTLRKCPADVPRDDLKLMAWGADMAPISYATPRQQNFIAWLQAHTIFIPVTGRSSEALQRTHLRFGDAVVGHGGGILQSGENGGLRHCPAWAATIQARTAPHLAMLDRLDSAVTAGAAAMAIGVRGKIVEEAGQPLYLVIKHRDADTGEDAKLHGLCRQVAEAHALSGWTLHINGNNVAYMPPGLGKRDAAEAILPRLRAQHPHLPVIGAGDSHTDLPFMQLCDFILTPGNSQIAGRLLA